MNLFEKFITESAEGKPMPLKGHTKITLTDVKTGKKEIVESDNMVTNAIRDVLNSNFDGCANFQTLMPLKKLFSGVLLFQENIAENANGYLIPSDLMNPMIGNAGPDPHATASIYRGNPNGGESQETPTSMKFVWDFATNQANGTINCVCLTPGAMGNIGIKPFDNTLSPYSAFGNIQVWSGESAADWTETIAERMPFLKVYDTYHYAIWIDGTTFKEKKVKHDHTQFGVMRNYSINTVERTRTATIRTMNADKIFVYEGVHEGVEYYYVMSCTSATTIMIDRIRKSDMTVDTLDVQCSDTAFYTGNVVSRNGSCPVFAISGDYLYFPNSSRNQFYKINLYNNADVSILPGEVLIDYGRGDDQYRDGAQFSTPIEISEGLIFGSSWIINGNSVYPLKRTNNVGCQNYYFAYQNRLWLSKRDGYPAACFGYAWPNYADRYGGPVNVLFPAFLSTINNLQDEIVKTNSKTMKVEYTITEA